MDDFENFVSLQKEDQTLKSFENDIIRAFAFKMLEKSACERFSVFEKESKDYIVAVRKRRRIRTSGANHLLRRFSQGKSIAVILSISNLIQNRSRTRNALKTIRQSGMSLRMFTNRLSAGTPLSRCRC